MKTGTTLIAIALAATVGVGVGYRFAPSGQPATSAPVTAEGGMPAKKLLYYRNPMGLPDTSPTPKKDSMGMDYIPVYEGEETTDDAGSVKLSPAKVQKLGVKTAQATLQTLDKSVRASGRVEVDESRTYAVTAKFEGYIERRFGSVTAAL